MKYLLLVAIALNILGIRHKVVILRKGETWIEKIRL
jgi:hypothetical protein